MNRQGIIMALGRGLSIHRLLDGSAEVRGLKARLKQKTKLMDELYPMYCKANAQKRNWQRIARAWRGCAIAWLFIAATGWSAFFWVLFLGGDC